MYLRATVSKPKSQEELFLEHYDWLVKWALHLTEGRREEANDLVHDLYVQLVHSRPNIDQADADRVRGYLYTMLRNLSVSKARRDGRDALSTLLIVDYDSVEYGLACVDRSQLILVRSDLARVCEYACIRRHTSRSASVLILRFFFGYYPSEIVRILQTTRAAIEKHLQAARQEARVYLEEPGKLRFLGQDVTPTRTFSAHLPDEPIALFAELRTRIFAGAKSECFPREVIEKRYAEGGQDGPSMSVRELAHVVSCPECLERMNRALALESLAERFPSDTVDRDGGNEPPRPSGTGSQSAKLKKRIRQTEEHRPKKLQIAVDGEILAAQRVSSSRSELQVKLEPSAKPAFIEVLSEQGIRLAYLQIDESVLRDPQPYKASVELSDGRFLEVKLSFPSGIPVVKLSYYDPLLEEEAIPATTPATGAEDSSNIPSKSVFGRSKAAAEKFLRSWLTSFESPWPLGLAMGAAALFLVLISNSLSKKTAPAQSAIPTANALLARSRELEEASIAHGGAVHSMFSLQTLSEDGKILESQRVESWRSLAPNRRALRLLDSKGKVLAGTWADATGKITTYDQKRGLRRGSQAGNPRSGFGDAWEFVPGAEAVSALSAAAGESQVHRHGDEYEIQYERRQLRSNPDVMSVTLVLDSSSIRPLSEDVTVAQQGRTREYRFQRLTYEVVPANQVQDSDFTPAPELVGLRTGLVHTDQGDRGTNLMLAALQLLSDLGSEVEQLVDIERLPDGRTEVSGVLPTSSQKTSVERLFLSLHGGGALKLDLHSRDEVRAASEPPKRSQVESLEQITVDETRIPFESDLRGPLSAQGLSGPELETRIRQIGNAAIDHGSRIHREAWSIRQIAVRDFSLRDLQLMQPEKRMLWVAILERHTSLLNQQLSSLYEDLAPLFHNRGASSPPSEATNSPLKNTNELAVLVNTLDHDCEDLDRQLMAGFTLSPGPPLQKPTIAKLAQLAADVRTREQILGETVDHLSKFAQAEPIK